MGNRQNEYVKRAIPEQKRAMGGKCSYRGCGERRLSCLEFAHIRQTPLSRTGPGRDRKEKLADVRAHPNAYTLKCERHHDTDKVTKDYDHRMRGLGRR
jgi:hypothetical protein